MRIFVGNPAPIEGATVFIDGVSVGLTGADGSLAVAEVTAGSHTIEAMKNGYNPDSATISVPETQSVTLTLTLIAKIMTEVRISSDKTTYVVGESTSLTLGLYDEAGNIVDHNRIVDYTVLLDGVWYAGWGQYGDDTSRGIIFSKPGTYTITGNFLGDDTYEPSSNTITITAITLTYTITVSVQGSSPIAGASVYFDYNYFGSTDSAGNISIGEVTEGWHNIWAEKAGYHPASADIYIPRTTSVTLRMIPIAPPLGEIRVKVSMWVVGHLYPLSGAPIYLDGVLAGKADTDGLLTITGVSEGTHKVKVAPAALTPITKNVTVPDGYAAFVFYLP